MASLGVLASACQQPVPRTESALRALFEERRAETGFPGLAFGWCFAGGRGGAVAVGHRDRDGQTPLVAGDRMLWGSVGKTFVAAVVLQLASEEKLRLDDPLSRHLGTLDGFERLPNAADLTLRQLLLHRSGVPDHVRKPEIWRAIREDPDRVWSTAELIACAFEDPPLAPAGAAFAYADTNYVLLGAVVEEIEGRGLFDSVRARLLEPLGLRGAVPSDRRVLPGLVQGHPALMREEWGLPARTLDAGGAFFMNPQFEHGGGGMYGDAESLARWMVLLAQLPTIAEDLRAERARGVPVAEGADERYGFGAQIWSSPYGDAVGHGGWYPGYRTETAWFAELGLGVAVMINTDAPEQTRSLRRLLLDGVGVLVAADGVSR